MKKTIIIALMLCASFAMAQVQTPSASPSGSTTATVGLTEIKIDYFRPRMRGRKIFGNTEDSLVPYGKIWRTGANSGTKISFSDDVVVEGKAVAKGEYLLFTWPGESTWSIALYSDLSLGGNTNEYNPEKEVVKFSVKPEKRSPQVETLTIGVGDIADDHKSAKIEIAWENTSVKFTIGVAYHDKVMASIEKNVINAEKEPEIGDYFQAALYYLETDQDLDKALTWISKVEASNPEAFWVLYQKARIQKALGDKEGARSSASASLENAKKAKNRDYQKMNETFIKSL